MVMLGSYYDKNNCRPVIVTGKRPQEISGKFYLKFDDVNSSANEYSASVNNKKENKMKTFYIVFTTAVLGVFVSGLAMLVNVQMDSAMQECQKEHSYGVCKEIFEGK